jgi:hypothetical protein
MNKTVENHSLHVAVDERKEKERKEKSIGIMSCSFSLVNCESRGATFFADNHNHNCVLV